jgi:hypothetical protein
MRCGNRKWKDCTEEVVEVVGCGELAEEGERELDECWRKICLLCGAQKGE